MTTTNLHLTTYNTVTDGSTLFYDYVNQNSGSLATSNMGIIDRFAGETSASITNATSGCFVTLESNATNLNAHILSDGIGTSVTKSASTVSIDLAVTGITSASYTVVEVDQYGRVISGSQTSTGGGGGHTIEEEGTILTQRDTMNFVGAGILASDVTSGSVSKTQVEVDWNITSGSISASQIVNIPTGTASVVVGAFTVGGQLNLNGTMVVL